MDDKVSQWINRICDINDNSSVDAVSYKEENESDTLTQALRKIAWVSHTVRTHRVKSIADLSGNWANLKIIKSIGKGGFGEVFLAYDTSLQCEVAVKFLNTEKALSVTQQHFLQEARNMARVRHPHVLAIHGATIDQGIAGYWSDYLDGDLLHEWVEKSGVGFEEKLRHMKNLTRAVAAIHNQGIVHGDIKASNIMVQPKRGMILLDFGSSQYVRAEASGWTVQMSPIAMAPEQEQGKLSTVKSDVFSLGLVFWQILMNRHPLIDIAKADLLASKKQLSEQVRSLPLSTTTKKLLSSMLQVDPDKRSDILDILKTLEKIQKAPLIRARKRNILTVVAALMTVAVISLWGNYKTIEAQKETQAINEVYASIIKSSSPIKEGQDVLLVDVLQKVGQGLRDNEDISREQKINNLIDLSTVYRQHSRYQAALEALDSLGNFNLSDSQQIKFLLQKAAIYADQHNFDLSEPLLLKAINIKSDKVDDINRLINARAVLARAYNETDRLSEVPKLLDDALSLWHNSVQNKAALANIYLVYGNYFEIKENYEQAYSYYQKSVESYRSVYGDKNLDTLLAQGAAATVLTYTEDKLQEGIEQQRIVLQEMKYFLGETHTSTLILEFNFGVAIAESGDIKKALDVLLPCIEKAEKSVGKDSGLLVVFKQNVAEAYFNSQQYDKAENLLREIIAVYSEKKGQYHEMTLSKRLNLVKHFYQSGQLEVGGSAMQKLRTDIIQYLGSGHSLIYEINSFHKHIKSKN